MSDMSLSEAADIVERLTRGLDGSKNQQACDLLIDHARATAEPEIAVGDTVTTAAELDRLPVGAKLGCLTGLGAATRGEFGWQHTDGIAGEAAERLILCHRYRVFDLPEVTS